MTEPISVVISALIAALISILTSFLQLAKMQKSFTPKNRQWIENLG